MKWVSIVALVWVSSVFAASQTPDCLDKRGNTVQINNDQVLDWKTSTPNQYTARAHITGHLTKIYRDATGHHHWEATLDSNQPGTLEVIYDEGFGPVPTPEIGQAVEACGDYITANAESREPSPDGALIHWIHISDESSHPSGFLILNGVLCGQGN